MRHPHTLRSRLFTWFLGAILLAMLTSAVVVGTTRPEATSSLERAAQHVAARLGASWEDRDATRAYVDEVRDVTGFEVRLVRDPAQLPGRLRMVVERGGAHTFGPDGLFVPVVRGGELVGALELSGGGAASGSRWRIVLALCAVVAVLSVMASRVANLLARPLEQLADAADRLGGGDLAFRTDVARSRRWVALEVRDVAISFNRMGARLEALVRGQRELLAAISHELRSPLGRARVAVEIVRDRLPVEPAPERSPLRALDDVERQLEAIDAILGDLLDVTRAGLSDLRKQSYPFAEWLRDRMSEEPAPPTTSLQVAPNALGMSVSFDGALLARVVHNLLLNARAHGHPDDLAVEVRLSREADGVRVSVRDRGPGFAPGFDERAFEPFVRGDAARSRPVVGAGHGLGLTLVRRIVEAHGGRVFARNADGGGAEVGFELPVAPAPV